MVADGKGILAADESSGTIEKRFDGIDVESTEANRRDYRTLLFTAPGAGTHISGVILFDETLRQNAADGTPLVEIIQDAGIIPGIKVDKGAKPLAGHPGETVTEGLDGLRERLEEYAELGARFTKWRAVYRIGEVIPSPACITTNAHALGRFAALSQEAGLAPVADPDALVDGGRERRGAGRGAGRVRGGGVRTLPNAQRGLPGEVRLSLHRGRRRTPAGRDPRDFRTPPRQRPGQRNPRGLGAG